MIPIHPPALETPPSETVVTRIRSNAAAHPERLALVCGTDQVTWGAFDTRINKVANHLLQLGLCTGDNVAVISPNSIPYAELFMGILRAGGCVTPLSSMASPQALQKMLTDCAPRAIFVAEQYFDLVRDFVFDLPLARFAIDFKHDGFEGYEDALAAAAPTDPVVPDQNERSV